ncbi:SDR family oxidoreductase [uncultured Bacteroides sp.]|jgi:NAD(P)-dependent dehydrogenase (short-subunit alcohol dehydrogenase family)|uniref:SDR family oxidoreductase n=1 Tax=uncultured Bacteroides sp. TaxID=162156 RepID=UPI00280A5A41|nr:SDR family oxidoreductase [uncultured Bacteroides sp.]
MNDMFDISGKVALVTGGSGVLGSNIAEGFLRAGAKVIIIGAHQERVDKALEHLKTISDSVWGVACNVLDMESLQAVKDKILAQWGRIDILVNAAGGNIPGGTLTVDQNIFDMKVADLNKVVDLNLYGSVYPCLVFGEIMAKQQSGSIVNVSSMAAYESITRVPGYSMAKSAVENFTRWLAQEMAIKFSEKIRVNAIAPGFFIGNQNRAILINPDGSLTDRSKKVIAKTPMKRFGDISELNGAVQFLCSDAASFITGAVLPVDGGFSAFSGV